jgi:nucleotide-binding universal stress UspA family protein
MSGLAPGSVVVGVDGTPFSDAALAWAVDYATARNAPLCVLHGAGSLGGDRIPLRGDARAMLADASRPVTDHAVSLVRRQAPGLEVTVRTPFEDPRHALLDVEDVSMVVVGTRGRGTVASLLLGSVSLAVVSYARAPVTVVRPPDVSGDRGAGEVVVGVDVDGSSQVALDLGFEIASMSGRPLVAVHAWPRHDLVYDAMRSADRLEAMHQHERRLAEALAGFGERYPDVPVTSRMSDDGAVAALVKASEQAAHLVLGSRPTQRIPRYFGSVSRSVVEHAHCPVTVARQPRERDEEVAG